MVFFQLYLKLWYKLDLGKKHVAALGNGGREETLGEGGEQEGVDAHPAGALPKNGHPAYRGFKNIFWL